MRDAELERPCHGVARESTPLFANEQGLPYQASLLRPFFHALLCDVFSVKVASVFMWHSFRSGLASALHAAKCPDDKIQLFCRWMTPYSLRTYRLLGPAEHTLWAESAELAVVDAVRANNAPVRTVARRVRN